MDVLKSSKITMCSYWAENSLRIALIMPTKTESLAGVNRFV